MSQQVNNPNNANHGNNDNDSDATISAAVVNARMDTFATTLTAIMDRLTALEARPTGSNNLGGQGNHGRDETPNDEREVRHPNPNPNPNLHLHNPIFEENNSPRRERNGRNNGFVNAQGQGRGRGRGRGFQEEFYYSERDDDFQEEDYWDQRPRQNDRGGRYQYREPRDPDQDGIGNVNVKIPSFDGKTDPDAYM